MTNLYTDDGIILDYDSLKKSYPDLCPQNFQSTPQKYKDFILYDSPLYKGTKQAFNPPRIHNGSFAAYKKKLRDSNGKNIDVAKTNGEIDLDGKSILKKKRILHLNSIRIRKTSSSYTNGTLTLDTTNLPNDININLDPNNHAIINEDKVEHYGNGNGIYNGCDTSNLSSYAIQKDNPYMNYNHAASNSLTSIKLKRNIGKNGANVSIEDKYISQSSSMHIEKDDGSLSLRSQTTQNDDIELCNNTNSVSKLDVNNNSRIDCDKERLIKNEFQPLPNFMRSLYSYTNIYAENKKYYLNPTA